MQSLEIAVFEAADPDGFATKQAELHRLLGSLFEGYVTSLGLRSATEPNVYADVVLWDSAANAEAAAAALGETEALAWFPPEIASIRLFDHLAPSRDAAAVLPSIGAAPVVELVVVKPSSLDGFVEAHAALHDRLAAEDVVAAELRLEPNANGLVGDVNGWASPDAMEQMAPKMMAVPKLAPVFDPTNEMVLFMPFATNVAP